MSNEYKERIAELVEYHVFSKDEELKIQNELDHVYRQAAKVDESDAKARAFDLVVKERDSAGRTMASKQSLEQYAVVNAFWNIDEIIVDYERGGSDD